MADGSPFQAGIDIKVAEILDRCTRCGRCVEVCPMPGPGGIDTTDPKAIVSGVLDILAGGAGTEAASTWAKICSGSGHCISACEDGVNPRLMLSLARVAEEQRRPDAERRTKAFGGFGAMTRGVRVLSRLQLPPALMARFGADEPALPDAEPPDIVFYTGCNVLKTPHIALLCLDIFDRLGVRYRVMGGPSHCCGVIQFRAGDIVTSGRVGFRAVEKLARPNAAKVLSWCPTCQTQLSEVVMPTKSAVENQPAPFDMAPVVRFLAERLDDLRPLLTRPVNKRVALHEHPGTAGVPEAARQLLEAIPGLTFVDLEQPRVGYMCNMLNPLPEFKRSVHLTILEQAEAAGVDTLAGVYHACHRELCSHERDWPFEVANFLELLGESMGIERPDLFKRLKLLQDVDAVLADSAELIDQWGLDLEEARSVIARDMLGEQPLPLGRGL